MTSRTMNFQYSKSQVLIGNCPIMPDQRPIGYCPSGRIHAATRIDRCAQNPRSAAKDQDTTCQKPMKSCPGEHKFARMRKGPDACNQGVTKPVPCTSCHRLAMRNQFGSMFAPALRIQIHQSPTSRAMILNKSSPTLMTCFPNKLVLSAAR